MLQLMYDSLDATYSLLVFDTQCSFFLLEVTKHSIHLYFFFFFRFLLSENGLRFLISLLTWKFGVSPLT